MSTRWGEIATLAAAAAQGPSAAGEEVRRLLEDGAYQRSLPTAPTPAAPAALPDLDARWLDHLLRLLGYAGAVVLGALAAVWLVRWLLARRSAGGEVTAPGDAPAAALDVRLERPEALAATGRFAEAIHQLLLETLAALSRADRLPPSFTSREILAAVRLPARARGALSGLVLAVELSRFGGEPAGAAEYRACLARFHDFLESHRGPAEPAAEAVA